MKTIKYISLTILYLATLSSCKLKSEYCEPRHPHTDKLIIDATWNDEISKTDKPSTLVLYYWEDNATHPTIKEATDNNGQYIYDLPKPGNYFMMLVGKLPNDYFYLNLQTDYYQFNGLISLTPQLANNLFVKDLGNIIIKDNSTIFLNTQVNQYSRNMNLNVIIEDMYEQPIAANVNFTGFATGVNMYNQQYFGNYDLKIPLEINQNTLSSDVTYLKTNGQKNIFTISITNPQNITVTKTIDFTENLRKFEQSNPFTEDLAIEACVTYSKINGEFNFVVKYITINGTVVYRVANA